MEKIEVMSKRILIVAQNFHPEFFKSTDIAVELSKRGYTIDVLTGIPNYPEGHFFNGYGVFKRRIESIHGAKVYRAFQIPRGSKPGAIRLSLNYLSFAICATLWVLFFFIFKRRYDAIVVHQTSPITQAIPAIILGKLRRIKVYTWVLDIWPDSVMAFLSRPRQVIFKPLNALTEWVYRNSSKILISSPGFRKLVNRYNDYDSKIYYFPNWCEDIAMMEDKPVPQLQGNLKIVMAGNISDATGMEGVVEVMKITRSNPDIRWYFIGGGNRVEWLRESVEQNNLHECCEVLGRYPFDAMASFYRQADIMFISLKPTTYPHLSNTVPARLQSYMAAGKPVVGMIGEGASQLIDSAACGLTVEAGDIEGCAEMILNIANNVEQLKKWGDNARRYYLDNFTKEQCITNLEHLLFD